MYWKGLGTPKDLGKAKMNYEKSCDTLNNSFGCYLLGGFYLLQTDNSASADFAKKYFEKACKLGHQEGCEELEKINNQ